MLVSLVKMGGGDEAIYTRAIIIKTSWNLQTQII